MAGLFALWFPTVSMESGSPYPILCTLLFPLGRRSRPSTAVPGVGGLGSCLLPPSLAEVSSGMGRGRGWRAGLGGGRWQQLLWAVLWGGGRRGCETGLGSCSQAKPPEWPLKQGLTLVSGKKPTLPAPEPSGEMGASPLLIPGGQCHGVKGPCAWSKCTPPRLLHTSVTLGRQPPPWTSVVTVQKLSKGQGQLGH